VGREKGKTFSPNKGPMVFTLLPYLFPFLPQALEISSAALILSGKATTTGFDFYAFN